MTIQEKMIFDAAKEKGLSDQKAAVFVRFWNIRFQMRLDPGYMDEWIDRFKKDFEYLKGKADCESMVAIAQACWEVIE